MAHAPQNPEYGALRDEHARAIGMPSPLPEQTEAAPAQDQDRTNGPRESRPDRPLIWTQEGGMVEQQASANEWFREANARKRGEFEAGRDDGKTGAYEARQDKPKVEWTREDEAVLKGARAQDERQQKEAQHEMNERGRDPAER